MTIAMAVFETRQGLQSYDPVRSRSRPLPAIPSFPAKSPPCDRAPGTGGTTGTRAWCNQSSSIPS